MKMLMFAMETSSVLVPTAPGEDMKYGLVIPRMIKPMYKEREALSVSL